MKKIMVIGVVAVLAAVVAYFHFAARPDDGPGEGFARGNGRVEATETYIAAKQAGRVERIHVNEGDSVKKGDVLAVMQTDVLEAQLNEVKAQLLQARTARASGEAQVALRLAEKVSAEAVVRQRESELDNAAKQLERTRSLLKDGASTEQQFDDDETKHRTAVASADAARAAVKESEASIVAARADMAGNVAAMEAAEAAVARIEVDLKDCQLVAPHDGRIQYRVVQPGEVVAAGAAILNLVNLGDVYMTFHLSAADAGRAALGSDARIVLDAFKEYPLPARVTYVASTAQFTPKTVETADEREKLMFRVKANVNPETLAAHQERVKVGLRGVAWVKLDPAAAWPEALATRAGTE